MPETADNWHTSLNWSGNYPTQETIDHYVETSRQVGKQLLDEGVEQFVVGVTLRDYLPFQEMDSFVAEYTMQVKDAYSRASFPTLEPTERITFAGVPASGKFVDSPTLESMRASLKERAREMKADKLAVQRTGNPDAEGVEELEDEELKAITADDSEYVINGVFAFAAIVDAKSYRRLLRDNRVYNVDVTATRVYQQIKGGGLSWEHYAKQVQLVGYVIFWDMERMGLDKFSAK